MSEKILGYGGHRPALAVDEKELKEVINGLERLFPNDDVALKKQIRSAMRSALRPTLKHLKASVPWESGQLRYSLGIINGKNIKNRWPTLYVGPRVKGKFRSRTMSGFYMYFLEYGTIKIAPKRYLDKSAAATKAQVYGSIIPKLKAAIGRRFKKKGLK